MLASVEHSPVDLSGVPLGQECRLTLGIQKLEHLKIIDEHEHVVYGVKAHYRHTVDPCVGAGVLEHSVTGTMLKTLHLSEI